jgi:hypothetical protein
MEKINLKKCTFIIPVRFDSNDRIENVKLCTKYINHYYDTNIIIYESDKKSVFKENINLENISYIFNETENELFYKTKCINDAVKSINTEYFCIYDADILLPINQINETIKLLNEGYETVYPYDGRFLNVPRFYYTNLINNLNTDVINQSACKLGLGMPELTPDRQSFGGCVFFNTESFKKYGMANEKMVSYGPEDCEIAFRFKLLSKFSRINGPLFHIDHVRFLNSNEDHKMVENNHHEFRKILRMNKEELTEYVKTWNWL